MSRAAADPEPRIALVVGATGVTGQPLVEHLLGTGRWTVLGAARRVDAPAAGGAARFRPLALDLSDASATCRALADAGPVSHVFWCAGDPDPGRRLAMMRNALDALANGGARRLRICLLQGTKYYGCHLGPFSVPARETDPRIPGADFYYAEEDLVRERAAACGWTWTALRPHAVCGWSTRNPLNVATALAVYGSLRRDLREPFAFPGSQAAWESRFQVMDAGLLARACEWAATEPACADTAFNVNNGAPFAWRDLWGGLAAAFGLPPAGPCGTPLAAWLSDKHAAWESLRARIGLRAFPFARLAPWVQGDYRAPNSRFACEYDVVSDLTRLRGTGFSASTGNLAMFTGLFARLRREGLVP